MQIKKVNIKLPEGNIDADIEIYDIKDKKKVLKIFESWKNLYQNIKEAGYSARTINLPEGISEVAFCIAMDTVRVRKIYGNANNSFDCYNLKTNKRIQIKATSVDNDLASFGPKSQWDELYFLRFCINGIIDGTFEVYKIVTDNEFYNRIVNIKKNETFKDQQNKGRRPRFSIVKEIIQKKNLKPIKILKLNEL